MKIGGFQPLSLCDYAGKLAAVVFTQGCNFRCPFCHNASLISLSAEKGQLIPMDDVLAKLEHRGGQIDAVVVSGGEPTLQEDLPDFLRTVKKMGFAIKLDTNGSRPSVLRRLLQLQLLDYVAMDVKAPRCKYAALTGMSRAPFGQIAESIRLLHKSGIPCEFRTTFAYPLLEETDLTEILADLPAGSVWRRQEFRVNAVFTPAVFVKRKRRKWVAATFQ